MKTLLLLTHSFPFGSGEDFLSAELKRASGFDRILVCPCSPMPGSTRTKKLPTGVGCVSLERRELGRSAYLRLLFAPGVLTELFRLLRSGRLTSGRVHELLYFTKHVQEIFDALKRAVSVEPGDEVTIYSYWFYDAAAAGARFADELRKRDVQVRQVSRAHGFDIHSERAKYGYLPLRSYLFHSVDRVFPCSDDGAETLKREAGPFAPKITRKYLGTEDHGVGPHSREPFHLVSCSYMVPVKRLHLIAEALKLADFPIIWTHIGSGPLEEEIRSRSAELPPLVKAEFLGQRANREILEYYRNTPVSVFVNVSSSEGIPVSVMEACSFGIPVVATNVGGTHELVSDGQNGFLLKADFSPEDLLGALRKIRSMPEEEYGALCDASRTCWEKKFNADVNYPEFYRNLSGGRA
jgi:colanic acid/amylovoran biosynthesis glycosyltransferase